MCAKSRGRRGRRGGGGMGASETATTQQQRKCLAENKHWQPSSTSCSPPLPPPPPTPSPSPSPPFPPSPFPPFPPSPISSSHLEHFLVETRFLRQHLQLPGVWVLVDLEVAFHNAQLVVLEGSSCTLRLCLTHPVCFHPRGVALKIQEGQNWIHLRFKWELTSM